MSYKEFSYFYDYFNYNADYDALFNKIVSLAKEGGVTGGIVCDLGCGTGELAFRFNDAGFDVIVTDENRKSYKIISTDKALGRVPESEQKSYPSGIKEPGRRISSAG